MARISEPERTALALDYDDNPDRFRTGRSVALQYGPGNDVHDAVAARLVDEGRSTVLDVGCGDGSLGRLLIDTPVRWVGLDLSARLLADAPPTSGARQRDVPAVPGCVVRRGERAVHAVPPAGAGARGGRGAACVTAGRLVRGSGAEPV